MSANLRVRAVLRGLGHRAVGRVDAGVDEADRDDRVEATLAEQLEPVVLVVLGLGRSGLKLVGLDVQIRLGPLQTGGGGVVERLVTPTTDVIGEADLDLLLGGRVPASLHHRRRHRRPIRLRQWPPRPPQRPVAIPLALGARRSPSHRPTPSPRWTQLDGSVPPACRNEAVSLTRLCHGVTRP